MIHEAIIELSNGEKLKVKEGQFIFTVTKYVHDGEILTSKAEPVELWYHANNGLIPCITQLLVKYDFFELEENSNKIYKSSSVVSIQNL